MHQRREGEQRDAATVCEAEVCAGKLSRGPEGKYAISREVIDPQEGVWL